jgi:putative spermidine/putrescine transport system permease protein
MISSSLAGTSPEQRAHRQRPWLGRAALIVPAVGLLAVVFYLPLVRLLSRSVVDPDTGGLTATAFERLAANDNIMLSFLTSLWLAAATVVLVLLIAYPLAYLLASLPPRLGAVLFVLVLVPFWTSLTVRMFAFWILLGRQGPLNGLLLATGLVDEPVTLLFTSFSVLVGFVHIGLPLMIFPLYASMRGIDRSLVLAANSLGASPFQAHRQVFLPLSLPGLVAGATLVFVTTIGYFIVPVLLGGKSENMVGQFIVQQVQQRHDIPLASAMTAVLLAIVVTVLFVFSRFANLDRLWSRGDETERP